MKKLCAWLSVLILVGFSSLSLAASKTATAVDINAADATAIAAAMKGVGKVKSDAIVKYRTTNGPFASVDDLAKVPGITKKIIDDNRATLSVSGAPAKAAASAPAPAAAAPKPAAPAAAAKPTTTK